MTVLGEQPVAAVVAAVAGCWHLLHFGQRDLVTVLAAAVAAAVGCLSSRRQRVWRMSGQTRKRLPLAFQIET